MVVAGEQAGAGVTQHLACFGLHAQGERDIEGFGRQPCLQGQEFVRRDAALAVAGAGVEEHEFDDFVDAGLVPRLVKG